MAIVERKPSLELGPAGGVTPAARRVFARPPSETGWKSWVTTIDHKKIGIMYGVSAMFFFLVGGCEAL